MSGVRTIARCLDLLESLANREMSLTAMADEIALPASTVHRLLQTLVDRGYVSRIPDRQTYVLGPRLLELCQSTDGTNRYLAAISVDLLQEASEAANETCTLTVRAGWQAMYVSQVEAKRTMNVSAELGTTVPLYATGVGKAILAYLDDEEVDSYLRQGPFPRLTSQTLIMPQQLRRQLRVVRERGFAVDKQEHEEGIVCVAAPVFRWGDNAMAALSISGPSARFNRERLAELGQLVVLTAEKISERCRRETAGGPVELGVKFIAGVR